MKKTLALLGLCLITLSLAGAAFAMEFSADVVRKGQMGEHTSKVYIKDNKVRMDSQEGPMGPGYTIMRQDQKVVWMVSPAQKSYMEVPLQGMTDLSQHPRGDEKLPGEISRKELGREVIDGHASVKYEITHQQAGQKFVIHQWIAQDLKLPVKTAAVDGSWSVEYRNIKKGPQPDSLFEPPAGFQKMAMPAMGPGMGMGQGMGQGRRPGQGMGPGKGMRSGPGMGMPPAQDQDDD